MRHLIEGGRDQAAQADDVHVFLTSFGENFVRGDHHAHINNIVVVAAEHDADDVLADIMHVALDRCHQHLGAGLRVARGQLLGLHVGQQDGHGALHDARALDDLWQEHLPGPEQVADDVHAGHQRPLDDFEWLRVLLPGLLGIRLDEVRDAFDQGVAQALFDRPRSPDLLDLLGRGRRALDGFGIGEEAVGGVGAAVEQGVLDQP